MISAQIIVDPRIATKKGYRLRIRIYEIGSRSYRHISLKKYQQSKELINDVEVRRVQFEIDGKIEYCNKNRLDLDAAFEVFKNGIPISDEDLEIKVLEAKLLELKRKRETIGFVAFYNLFINNKKQKHENVNLFKSALNHFKMFLTAKKINDIDINQIDYSLVNDLDLYFKQHESERKIKQLSNRTINSYFLRYAIVFNEAHKYEKYNVKAENPFKLIKRKAVEESNVKKNYSLNSLKKYFNTDFDDLGSNLFFSYNVVKKIHMFQLLIGGVDFEDLSHLKWSDIKDGRIIFKRHKNKRLNNGGKTISNKLFDTALHIIDELGTKESQFIFSFIPSVKEDHKGYRLAIERFNNSCRKIDKKFYFSDSKLRSKTMRYTFRTIAGNLMINQMIIENLMGHSNNSVSMGYQGATPYEIQDMEHLKIIETVFE